MILLLLCDIYNDNFLPNYNDQFDSFFKVYLIFIFLAI